MRIEQNLCPTDRYSLKCPYRRTPTRVVVHNTANDAPAANEIAYMLRREDEVSFHFAVDDEKAVQGLPLERNAWASGDGHGPGNMEGIHVEICYSLSGGERFDRAEENAAELIADLLTHYGWGLERVTKHQDYDGKYCPHRTLDRGWERFLELVRQRLPRQEEPENEEGSPMTYEQWKAYYQRYRAEEAARPVSDWAREAVELCRERGWLTGDENGRLRPRSPITRQEAAVLFSRARQAGFSSRGQLPESKK